MADSTVYCIYNMYIVYMSMILRNSFDPLAITITIELQPCPLFQVVIAVSWPIPYKNPLRKLFFNIGFQFNYNEPFQLSSFYNATYFQNPFSNRDLRPNDMESDKQENIVETSTLHAQIPSTVDSLDAVNETIRMPKAISGRSNGFRYPAEHINDDNRLIGTDLTAAQLYEGIEEHLFT